MPGNTKLQCPGRRRLGERIFLAPEERREVVLSVIRGARKRLDLSLFRCSDRQVIEELARAIERGVRVEALLTPRARGWRKKLEDLGALLGGLGVRVHRYRRPHIKYHAKYIVADDGPALIASLNFTRKCFHDTCDFIVLTWDQDVVSGLMALFDADCRASGRFCSRRLSRRLIVGPERARGRITSLLCQARRSIRIIDHRLDDPAITALLRARRADGITVEVLGRGALGDRLSHGKMILVDDATAMVGSIALSPSSLDSRRELAVMVRDRDCVMQLRQYFRTFAEGAKLCGKEAMS